MRIKELTPWQLALLENLVRREIDQQPPGDSPYVSSLKALSRNLEDSTARKAA